ncbi:MAG: HlyD family type I secretion periplasmic adaptor subunit [Proteobacteria bacterium]|nr:HlyD family type I secretion periplasmic adaptor subunit [Pseudomonadota bacterium]
MSGSHELDNPALPPLPAWRGRVIAGIGVGVSGFLGFVAWLFFAQLSGAVVAGGQVVVESEVKKVQHQNGGTLEAILVQNGSRVKAGEIVARLDGTLARASLGQVQSQLVQLTGRQARLEAERDGRAMLKLPPDYLESGQEAKDVAAGEQRLHDESRQVRQSMMDQLKERAGQFEAEIAGLVAQQQSNRRQAELIVGELKGVQDLYDKNLVPVTRLNALQRDAARLDGENGALGAAIAKARGQIAELNLQLLSIEPKARAEAVKELREVEAQIAQLSEKKVAALDTLARIDIRAPQAGLVHELKVHTVGGVVGSGETLMLIVPEGERLAVDIRINPTDIDQLYLGQKTMLRFVALNQRTTPELVASLSRIGADAVREPHNGLTYFVARVSVHENELKKLNGAALVPGMPVEAFVETGARSAFSYFAKPLTDAYERAYREN